MQLEFLQDRNFERFLESINNGDGQSISEQDIETFVKLLPQQAEISKFKDRLQEYNLESFTDLQTIKAPFVMKQLGKPEEFVIKILENEEIIEKAKIMLVLIKAESDFDQLNQACVKWAQLRDGFAHDCEMLTHVLSTAFKVSMLMANKGKKEP
jgi:hypothetical protein